MSESSDYLDLSRRVAWEHRGTGEQGRSLEHLTVDGDHARIEYHGLTDLVPPATLTTTNREVMRWELAKYLAAQNHAAAERAIPECERRSTARAIRQQRQAAYIAASTCTECRNTGWVEDVDEGTASLCPCCMGATSVD